MLKFSHVFNILEIRNHGDNRMLNDYIFVYVSISNYTLQQS